jgi:predicted RNA-binding protein Jag
MQATTIQTAITKIQQEIKNLTGLDLNFNVENFETGYFVESNDFIERLDAFTRQIFKTVKISFRVNTEIEGDMINTRISAKYSHHAGGSNGVTLFGITFG